MLRQTQAQVVAGSAFTSQTGAATMLLEGCTPMRFFCEELLILF